MAEEKDIQKLLAKNLAVSQEILSIARSTKRHIMMRNIFSWLKLIIIVGPVLAAYFYLWPIVQQIMSGNNSLLKQTFPFNLISIPLEANQLLKGEEANNLKLKELLKGVDIDQLQKSLKQSTK